MNILEFAYRLGVDKEDADAGDGVVEAVNRLSENASSPLTSIGLVGTIFLALADALEVDAYDALEAVSVALRHHTSVQYEEEADEDYGADDVDGVSQHDHALVRDTWEREDAAEAARGRWNFWGADGAEGEDEF